MASHVVKHWDKFTVQTESKQILKLTHHKQ